MRVLKWLPIALALLAALGAAFVAGLLSRGSLDILCSGNYQPYVTREPVDIAPGIHLGAGTALLIRSCEYADQGRLDFPVDRALMDHVSRLPAQD